MSHPPPDGYANVKTCFLAASLERPYTSSCDIEAGTIVQKRNWTIKARNSAGWEIDFSGVFERPPSREELVRGLLNPALLKGEQSIQSCARVENAEHRLAELGFIVTSLSDGPI